MTKVLQKITAAFEPLAKQGTRGGAAMEVGAFAHACKQISVLFGHLGSHGNAFKFAQKDYEAKVDDLMEASKSFKTLDKMIEKDMEGGCVKELGSHTRNLLKVKRGLDLVRVLCEKIVTLEGNSLKAVVSETYDKVFGRHHGQDIKKAVEAAMHGLPSKHQLFGMLNEDENSAKVAMQRFIRASGPVIQYIEELFNSRNLGIDW